MFPWLWVFGMINIINDMGTPNKIVFLLLTEGPDCIPKISRHRAIKEQTRLGEEPRENSPISPIMRTERQDTSHEPL